MQSGLFIALQRGEEEIKERFAALQSLSDVADLLEIESSYLRRILYYRREQDRYRSFEIGKRNGGVRTITAPPNALAILQAKLNQVLQIVYRRKRNVHGFVSSRSILTNARCHVGRRWVLNIDLKDYFPSINFGRVRGALMKPPYKVGRRAALVITQIGTTNKALPQGAPSSPMLANLVCSRLDGDLDGLATRHRLMFTRYCDDLTFSTRSTQFPAEIASLTAGSVGDNVVIGPALQSVIEANGFEINPAKSRLQFKDAHQEVTGITVNLFANVRRSLVREVRAMLHEWDRHGIDDAANDFIEEYARKAYAGSRVDAFKAVLRGKIEYIGMVRGRTDVVYANLRAKLHGLDSSLIGAAPTEVTWPVVEQFPRDGNVRWDKHYNRIRDSVRQLEIKLENGDVRSGTAFGLFPEVCCTAAHNFKGQAFLIDSGSKTPITSIRTHPTRGLDIDCALFEAPGLAPLSIDRRPPGPGEPVAVIGYASIPQRQPACGLFPGHIEAVATDYGSVVTYLQAAINGSGGMSGSPVVNRFGRVIGLVAESVFEQTQTGVPRREFFSVLPIGYALEAAKDGKPLELTVESRDK